MGKKHGGARSGAGRKKKPITPEVAQRALSRIGEENEWVSNYKKAKKSKSTGECVRILTMLRRFAFGEPVATVNHLHDKPIDLNVNVSMAEIVREVRLRKQEYERGRK